MTGSAPPPPPDPFGDDPSGRNPYGQQQPPGQPPYGQQPPGQGPYGQDPSYGGPAGGYGGGPALGGPLRRLAARIIDSIIVGLVAGLISWPITDWDYDDMSFGNQFSSGLIFSLVYFVYEGFQLDRFGRTLGKRVVRIKVVRVADGGPIGGSIAWTRAGVYTLPPIVPCLGTIFWLVNVLWQFWDQPWHQCLHDKVAHTTVISGS